MFNIQKDDDKSNSSHGMAFNLIGEWRFSNEFARNVLIFGVDSSSLSILIITKMIF